MRNIYFAQYIHLIRCSKRMKRRRTKNKQQREEGTKGNIRKKQNTEKLFKENGQIFPIMITLNNVAIKKM